MAAHEIHRLESYQSGGSFVGNDTKEETTKVASGSGSKPVLHAQFSLIGQSSDDGSEGGEIFERSTNKYCAFAREKLVLSIAFCVCIILIVASSSSIRNISQEKTLEQKSCPIQSSFGVSQDLMKLENTHSIENKTNGAVATDHQICSKMGVSILEDLGGNAADAAVTTALCLGVVNPSSSGLGGGAFILIHSDAPMLKKDSATPPFEDARSAETKMKERRRTNEMQQTENTSYSTPAEANVIIKEHSPSQRGKVTEVIDCRETAPMNATFDMYEALPESSTLGGLSIAVPGELRGLELLHYRHGSLSWSEVVRPAMELARDGFQVSNYLAKAIEEKKEYFGMMPDLAYTVTKDNDGVTPLKEGDIMKRKRLAKTLKLIMERGGEVLYEGDLAKMLAMDIHQQGGIITSSDLSNYRPVLRDPLIASVSGYKVVGVPPPSSGGATIIGLLRFLVRFALPLASLADTLSKHWYVEACKHVFAIRMSLSDPKYDHERNADAVSDLVKGNYIEKLQNMTMDDEVLNLSQYGGKKWAQLEDTDGTGAMKDAQEGDRRMLRSESERRKLRLFNYLEDHGTTSLSVVDKHRNSVTITSSINLHFGSKVASPSTGFILNNQMDDFATPGRANFFGLRPSESNYIVPGKRPLSSMSPTMVFRTSRNFDGTLGKLVLSLGGSGGPKIITGVAQVIINHVLLGMPLYESVMAARIHNQLVYHGAAASSIEEGQQTHLSDRTRLALEARGQQLISTKLGLGSVQAVAIDLESNTLSAVSDIRKNGVPDAY
eukprot:scaffold12205_cov115-Skeletonema_dohrnii-CCMP3373.AAC.7